MFKAIVRINGEKKTGTEILLMIYHQHEVWVRLNQSTYVIFGFDGIQSSAIILLNEDGIVTCVNDEHSLKT